MRVAPPVPILRIFDVAKAPAHVHGTGCSDVIGRSSLSLP
jgi:hypothetical protein